MFNAVCVFLLAFSEFPQNLHEVNKGCTLLQNILDHLCTIKRADLQDPHPHEILIKPLAKDQHRKKHVMSSCITPLKKQTKQKI